MFGGLELKGSAPGSSQAEEGKGNGEDNQADASAAAPASGASAFSFMVAPPASATAPAPAPEAPTAAAGPSSAFSFLNGGSAAAPPPAAAAASSGFSFMAAAAPAGGAASAAAQPQAPASTSSFNFLAAGDGAAAATATADTTTQQQPPPETEPSPAQSTAEASDDPQSQSQSQSPAASASSSGFSFLAGGAISSAQPGAMPAGAGITFAAVSGPSVGVKKKKKTRANRVGVGAASAAPPATAAPPSIPEPSAISSETSKSSSTADAAADAARRAEQFMQQKAMESATTTATTAEATMPPEITSAPSKDEVVAAAERAAKEAQAQMARQTSASSSSSATNRFMGGFFKSFGGNGPDKTASTGPASSNNSKHDANAKPPTTVAAPAPAPSASINPAANQNDSANKLASAERESKQIKGSSALPSSTSGAASSAATVTAASTTWEPPQLQNKPLAPLSSFAPATKPAATSAAPAAHTSSSTMPSLASPPPSTIGSMLLPPTTIVPSVATSAPKSKGLQKLEQLQWKFSLQVQQAWQSVQNTKSQQVMLQQERFVAMAKYQLCQQQIQQAEQQLQVAAEQEDYELAGKLSEGVENHQREQAEIDALLKSTERALEQVQSQISVVIQNVSICFETLSNELKELKRQEQDGSNSDAASSGTSNLVTILEKFAEVSKMLSAEEERLTQDFKHLERDDKLVQEERDELERSISEQSGIFEKQKEECAAELEKTEETIVELRKQLDEAQKKATELRTAKYGYDDQIAKVRVKFSRQLTRVEKKERTVAENRSEWELESSSLKRQKEAHELQVETHSNALLEQEELMQTIDSEEVKCLEFIDLWKKTQEDDDDVAGEDKDGSNEGGMAELQANVVKCEAAANEAKLNLRTASQAIADLESEHAGLLQRIPQLEAEKKAAAARRDFKAAGKASKEMNDAMARSKVVAEELAGSAATKKSEAEAELERCQVEYDKAKQIAMEKESIFGRKEMEALAKRIQKVTLVKREMLSKATATGASKQANKAVARDGSKRKQNSVHEVACTVLDGQIKVLHEEGEALGEKYGGWEELLAQYVSAEEDGGESHAEEADENAATSAPSSSTPNGETQPDVAHDNTGSDDAANAVSDDAGTGDGADTSNTAPAATTEEPSTEDKIRKVRELLQRVKQAEVDLEAAAGREDYDQAAELHEVFLSLQAELELINLNDEQMELAMSDDPIPSSSTTTPSSTTTASETVVGSGNNEDGNDADDANHADDGAGPAAVEASKDLMPAENGAAADTEEPSATEQATDSAENETAAAAAAASPSPSSDVKDGGAAHENDNEESNTDVADATVVTETADEAETKVNGAKVDAETNGHGEEGDTAAPAQEDS